MDTWILRCCYCVEQLGEYDENDGQVALPVAKALLQNLEYMCNTTVMRQLQQQQQQPNCLQARGLELEGAFLHAVVSPWRAFQVTSVATAHVGSPELKMCFSRRESITF